MQSDTASADGNDNSRRSGRCGSLEAEDLSCGIAETGHDTDGCRARFNSNRLRRAAPRGKHNLLGANEVTAKRQPYQQGMVFRCNTDGSHFETLGWNFRNNWMATLDSFGTIWEINALSLRMELVSKGLGMTYLDERLIRENQDLSLRKIDGLKLHTLNMTKGRPSAAAVLRLARLVRESEADIDVLAYLVGQFGAPGITFWVEMGAERWRDPRIAWNAHSNRSIAQETACWFRVLK